MAVLPGRAGTREPQVSFVHERRGLEGVPRPFAPHVSGRQPAEFVVDGRGGGVRGFGRRGRVGHAWATFYSRKRLGRSAAPG